MSKSFKPGPPCKTCHGKKVIVVKTHSGKGCSEKTVQCPACRGTGVAGLILK